MVGKNGNGAKLSLRERLESVPLKSEPVEIPGYPTLYLREMTAMERVAYEREVLEEDPKRQVDRRKVLAAYVARHLVDETGERLYGDSVLECDALMEHVSFAVLDYLYDQCVALFRWTKSAVEALDKAKEELKADPSSTSSKS